jgi:hypothetical protein
MGSEIEAHARPPGPRILSENQAATLAKARVDYL